jgi:hypothetical protein
MRYRLIRISMRRIQVLSIFLLVFLCSNGWAQAGTEKKEKTGPAKIEPSEKGGTEKTVTPVKDKTLKPKIISAEKEKKKTEVKVTPGRKAAEKEKVGKEEKAGGKPAGSDINGSILFIEEGAYKYLRIPGFKPEISAKKHNNTDGEGELVRIPDKIEIEDTKEEPGGLFGFKRDTSDMLVKIFLGVMIFTIFLLYRARSRRKSSKVLRRYPNK